MSDNTYTFRQKLQYNFQKQADFAREYSALYRRIHSNVSKWLDAVTADSDPIVVWLEKVAAGRSPFLAPNLLAAALHQRILADDPRVADLATFYPGSDHYQRAEYPFGTVLREAIMATRPALGPFMRSANVQTNETGRGFTWLWPLSYVGWDAVHLLDLGASAGLNLAASERRFEVADVTGRSLLRLGNWSDPQSEAQFRIRAQGDIPDQRLSHTAPLPKILSRTGTDMHPFLLDTVEKEQILLSYIWADQLERMARLREGLDAYHLIQRSDVPIKLSPVHLPEQLGGFLVGNSSFGDAPTVIYNTYMTTYLPEKGATLLAIIGDWARKQTHPVIWFQLEPARGASRFGWCSITVDLWEADYHRQWQLAISHPHVTALEFSSGLTDFLDFWSRR